MKTSNKFTLLLLVSFCSSGLFSVAVAQNQARRSEAMNRVRSEARPSVRSESGSRNIFQNEGRLNLPERNVQPNTGNRNVFGQQDRGTIKSNINRGPDPLITERRTPLLNESRNSNRSRDYNSGRDYNNNYDNNRNNAYNRNTDRANYNRNYGSNYSSRNYNDQPNNYYGNRSPVRYVYPGAPRYRELPRTSIAINFGGNPYYYNDGLFFNYYGGFYQPVYAPSGIRVQTLPFDYLSFNVGPKRYYYNNGTYYQPYNNNEYQVVDAPMGATLSDLPRGAKSINLNGEKMYEFNGTYYNEDRDSKGRKVYVVVGKNGAVNNSQAADNDLPVYDYIPGDITDRLPDGSKSEMVNGQQLFVSLEGVYFKIKTEDNRTRYMVIEPPIKTNPVNDGKL